MEQSRDINHAIAIFRKYGGVLRTGQALGYGIHPAALYRLLGDGTLARLARGLYRLDETSESSNPDLTVVATKAPGGVICLTSALTYHDITTQIPRVVHVAVPRGCYAGLRLRTPPVRVYRFNAATFNDGIEVHQIDGEPVRIYGVARTLADCFKYRNKLGIDVAVEALRFARARKNISNRDILRFACLLRQERIMAPYLEAIE